jgi:glutamate/tyrosine decarboxylase-like PLP-dependent enzyme
MTVSETVALPKRGVDWKELEATLSTRRSEDATWEAGSFSLWWPQLRSDVYLAAMSAHSIYAHANAMYTFDAPGLRKVQDDLEAMIAEILRAPAGARVTLTAGGSESNLLAVKAARDWARAERGITGRPHVVAPASAHPSFDKACALFDMEITKVPIKSDFSADASALASAITQDTVMVVGSAPQYPQGVIDDISAVAAIAREAEVWMHVDACVGGFLLPFLRRLGELDTEFDFTIPGVWSVSADLHKFGHCPHGMSSLTLVDGRLYQYQRYELPRSGAGSYATPGLLGSRPGGSLASSWAAMMTLGEQGYIEIATTFVRNAALFASGVQTIPGLSMLCPSRAGIVVIAGSDEVPIPALMKALKRRRPAYWSAPPPALHLLMEPVSEDVVERYVVDLRAAADEVRSGGIPVAQDAQPVYVED